MASGASRWAPSIKPVDELVADRRPGLFPLEDQLQPFRAGESDFGRGDQHRGVVSADVSMRSVVIRQLAW